MSVTSNLEMVKAKIAEARDRQKDLGEDVVIVAATKTRTVHEIEEAIALLNTANMLLLAANAGENPKK